MARQIVLFKGLDNNPNEEYFGLWVTNGTAAGTHEVTGISGVDADGIDPYDLTAFGREVLFNGIDTSGNYVLLVSNGTAGGTYELTGITGANPGYFYPSSLVVFGNEVLFDGYYNNDQQGLWVTNGTAAGTHQLTGISGADLGSSGFIPLDLTVLGNEVLFNGTDTSESNGLWVTNGTSAGTAELGFSGAAPVGVNPTDITVFGSEALFNGTDATGYTFPGSGNHDLWVTNGTGTGTFELTGIGGAATTGLNPSDFTIFSSAVLFKSLDAAGGLGVWVTNGTMLGTHEITGISGVFTGVSGISAPGLHAGSFTVYNGEVLFVGEDTAGNDSLWVTNGAAAGTHELTGISNTYTGSFGFSPRDLTVVNGEVVFAGVDTADHLGLWVTNGTAAGTHELTGISGASTQGLTPVFLELLSLATTAEDFYASGTSDVLYRNDATGDTGFYAISNGANTGWHDIGASSTAYSIVGTGDFYGTGTADILYRNAASGDTGFYAISNGANAGWHDIGASSTAYSVVGVGDFTGSGTADVLYRNNTTGDTGFYAIANGVNTGWHDVGASSTAYGVVGTGDFMGNGTDDILYRNSTTGDTGFYAIVNGVNTRW